jgi:hypothetical protein
MEDSPLYFGEEGVSLYNKEEDMLIDEWVVRYGCTYVIQKCDENIFIAKRSQWKILSIETCYY